MARTTARGGYMKPSSHLHGLTVFPTQPVEIYNWATQEKKKEAWWKHPLHHAKYMAVTLAVNVILFPPEHYFWEKVIGLHF
jgi:hypothetical protein